MKCLTCKNPMNVLIGDYDYSHLAGLRGVTVILRDITTYQCERCGPTSALVQIRCLGPLTRELEAAKTLHVKQLWCSFLDKEWGIAFEPTAQPQADRRRRKRGG